MITLRPHQNRGLDALAKYQKGQCVFPTGAGKTLVAIMDAVREFQKETSQTIVVVCPRILLVEQLCSEFLEHITNANVLHVHSGETRHFKTTKSERIKLFVDVCNKVNEHVIIFTTYNSLHRIQESGIDVNTIYFDEAHNSVKRNFFGPTEYFSAQSDRCYFFTATRKTSVTINKPGMNDRDVYGDIICRVSAPELVSGGYIIPPKIQTKTFDMHDTRMIGPEVDCVNVLETIDDTDTKKILVCVKSAKQLINLMSHTDFASQLNQRGYSYLYITSKTGAIVDGKKVNREQFFDTLNEWGKDPEKKFVVLHRSILSEGINVSELETVIFLRNMDTIEMVQTIGRVLRLGGTHKTYGLCVVPVYSKVGISTERALQNVVDTVFEKGELLDSVVRR
jgi:superfamily II DNA or RNA helicase